VQVRKFYEELRKNRNRKTPSFLNSPLVKKFLVTRQDMAYKLAPGGETVLDIGCDYGHLLYMLTDKYNHAHGIDILPEPIRRINEKTVNNGRISAAVGDANEALNFPDSSFDTVIATAVIEHLFDPYFFVRECHRILTSNGTLIIEAPNVAWLPNRIRTLVGRLPVTSDDPGWDGGHLHYFTASSLRTLLTENGFRVVKITNCGLLANIRKIWGTLLAADIVIVAKKEVSS